MADLLQIRDMVVSYGGIEAVKGISLDVPEGKIVTLIGANGAGKSTTLKTIAGIVKPVSSSILFAGEELRGKSTDEIVARGITLVPEGRRVFGNMTVLENLKIGAYLRRDSLTDDLERVYALFPRLKERKWQLAGTLSGGEQQMLAVGRALMSRPKVIMEKYCRNVPPESHALAKKFWPGPLTVVLRSRKLVPEIGRAHV